MSIQQIKLELVETLEDTGYDVRAFVPAGINPPEILIGEGDPFIEPLPDQNFGNLDQFKINFSVICINSEPDNESATDTLYDMIEKVLENTVGWFVSVEAPQQGTVGEYQYLSSVISVSTVFHLQD